MKASSTLRMVALAAAVAASVLLSTAMIPINRDAIRQRLVELYGIPREYKVPMRDGTLLSTVVYIPGRNTTGKFPAVIDRSPYGHFATELLALLFCPLGFVAVMQDLRGSGQSEGEFSLWRTDGADTFDTLAWIEKQEWSNGHVYQIGASADGNAALAGGVNEMPPQLKAQFVIWATGSGHGTAYQGGAYVKDLIDRWLDGSGFPESIQEVKDNEIYTDAFWDSVEMSNKYGRCYFPSVMWAGWYDIFLQGTIDAWAFYQSAASGCPGQSTLFIDAHGHCGGFDAGESYFPLSRLALPLLQAYDLFQAVENGPSTGATALKNVRGPDDADVVTFYVMGPGEEATVGNYWTTLPAFPQATITPYYMQADNSLTLTPPANSSSFFEYVYDPANPVPTRGGHNLFGDCGQYDQRSNEARPDVISFTTPVLTQHTVVTGRVRATLFVSSNMNDTDFTAQITDVYPDGRSMLITNGILRMRWRESNRFTTPMVPGQVYQISVDLWTTSVIFETGHRIRISISSSNYPRYSATRNNGLLMSFEESAPARVATNRLYTSALYPSRLDLPLVSFEAVPNNYQVRPRFDRPELAELARFLDLTFSDTF